MDTAVLERKIMSEITWKELKDAVELAGATDDTHVESIRQIAPGTSIKELFITVGSLGLDID